MGYMTTPGPRGHRPWRSDPFSKVLGLVFTSIMAVLLGIQYWNPNKRVIPVVVSLIVFGVAWRLSMAAAVNMLVFLLPYPKGTVFGSTNLAFILLVFIIWLLRVSVRMSDRPRSSPLNVPIAGMLLWGVLSFYNVQSERVLPLAIINYELFLSCVILYYLIINSVRTQEDLQRFHMAQMVTAFTVFLIAAWEARHAGQVLIPGLLDFTSTAGHDFNTRDVRVGASFRDYELLSEYCGLMFLMTMFQLARVRTQLATWVFGLFGLFNLYTMFTTVTRGVIIALAMALPYLFYTIRRTLNPVKFMSAVSAILVLAISMNFVVAKFTNSGDMFSRLATTKVVHGVVPEAREGAWTNAWNRAWVHPILGQGPFYDEIEGYEYWWPHNVYLFIANLYGFPGLGLYLALLIGLWMIMKPKVGDLRHASYADAFLIVGRTQLIMFALNELKIDYLRNGIYQFQVWQMFGTWTAAYLVARDYGVGSQHEASLTPGTPDTPPTHRMVA